MKKSLYVSILVVFALLSSTLFGCSRLYDAKKSDSKTTFQSEEHSINSSNQKVYLSEMISTGEIPYDKFICSYGYGVYCTDTDLFPFKYNSKYGYADATGKVIISERYDEAKMFSEGKAFVKTNNQWKIIDILGNELYIIPDDYFEAADYFEGTSSFFKNGKAILVYRKTVDRSDEGYGFADEILKILVIYEDMKTKEVEIVTEEGLQYKIVNTPEFSGLITYNLDRTKNELGQYISTSVYRLFDLNGREIWKALPNQEIVNEQGAIGVEYYTALGKKYYNSVYMSSGLDALSVENGYMNIFDENLKWGLLNTQTGEVEIECKYDFLGVYSNGFCNVCSYGKWGYINLKGNEIIKTKYKYADPFVDDYAIVISEDNSLLTIDINENIIYETTGVLDSNDTSSYSVINSNTGKAALYVIYKRYNGFKLLNSIGEIILYGHDDLVAVTDNFVFADSKMYKIDRILV